MSRTKVVGSLSITHLGVSHSIKRQTIFNPGETKATPLIVALEKNLKTLFLIGALAATTVQSAGAVFVMCKAAVIVASPASVTLSAISAAPTADAALPKRSPAMRKAQSKKQGFFHRLGRRLMRDATASKIAAALLAFFLGGFGVHRFYLGHNTEGFMQLAGSLFGIGFLFLGLSTFSIWLTFLGATMLSVVGIWALVDFICILAGSLQPLNGSYED